jgi:VIT1/CCC1 family predicted Fe2+/Mn2+ transporter
MEMQMFRRHKEGHKTQRAGWLRAAVLGANDGILSTASLILGVAAATPKGSGIMIAGIAGVVAGSMSMAAGEYVSVSSQADTEKADLELEKKELQFDRKYELKELAAIYVGRGLQPGLATEVAEQLMAHDALGAHARDELGINAAFAPKPVQAAVTSAVSFAIGGLLPLTALLVARTMLMPIVAGSSLLFLAFLGGIGAKIGGAPIPRAAVRVTFWGALAMALTTAVGAVFSTHVG